MTEKVFYEWLKAQPYDDKIVSLKYKYSFEREWTYSNELLEVDPTADDPYIWGTDWYGNSVIKFIGKSIYALMHYEVVQIGKHGY